MSWFRRSLSRSLLEIDEPPRDARFRRPAALDRAPSPLSRPVGPGQANRPDDVAGLERALGSQGYLDLNRARRPRGRFDPDLDRSIRRFQADNRLEVDGLAKPDGPTFGTLARRLGEARGTPRPLDASVHSANARTVRAMRRTTDLGSMPTLVADAHLSGGNADAELDDLFGQLRAAEPARADDLFRAANAEVRRRTGRPLPAARFPTLLADADEGDDGETPEPPEPDAPTPPKPKDPGGEEPEGPEPETPDRPEDKKPEDERESCTKKWLDSRDATKAVLNNAAELSQVEFLIGRKKEDMERLKNEPIEPLAASVSPPPRLPPGKRKPRDLIAPLVNLFGRTLDPGRTQRVIERLDTRRDRIARLEAELENLEAEKKRLEGEREGHLLWEALKKRELEDCEARQGQRSRSQRRG